MDGPQNVTPTEIYTSPSTWFSNFANNTASSFTRLTPEKIIQLVIVIGAYALIIRPLILKGGAKVQAKVHEQDHKDNTGAVEAAPRKALAELRGYGGKEVQLDDSEDENESAIAGADWGKRARARQRKIVKLALEEHERRLRESREEEEDKDIAEFLED